MTCGPCVFKGWLKSKKGSVCPRKCGQPSHRCGCVDDIFVMGASEDPQLLAVSGMGFGHLVEDSLLALPQRQLSTLVHGSALGLSVEGLVLQPLCAPCFLPKTLVRGTASRSCDFPFQVIVSRGGRFLEAPVSGNQQLSNDGMLVILAAGDRGLYEDCSSCFQAMGKTSFFLGNTPAHLSGHCRPGGWVGHIPSRAP